MKQLRIESDSVSQTISVARRVAHFLKRGDVIGLVGDLGSGKTTFVRGLAQGLGLRNTINSPSFVILKIYAQKITLYHFDLYRVQSLKDLEDIGYEDFISDSGICVIEWVDRAEKILPSAYLKVCIQITGNAARTMRFTGYGVHYHRLLRALAREIAAKRRLRHSLGKKII